MPLFFKHQRHAPCMPWGVVGAIGGAVVNNAMAPSGGGGGGSSQQSSSEPWAMAQPWMMSNIMNGMQQQSQLTAQPFSPQQEAAYDNSYALNDYMRGLVPGLLGQLGGQQVGFDPKNPDARPQAWNWSGLLSDNAPDLGQKSVLNAKPPAASGAAPAQQGGDFVQQGYGDPLIEQQMKQFGGLGGNTLYIDPSKYTGKLGSFKYGDQMPQPGTQAYKDMNDYFAYGGADPLNKYGRGGSMGFGRDGGGGIGDTGANAAAAASGNTAW
jgi:hypothetical protein